MQAELQSLQEYGAWSIVEKPENAKVITCKWLFKLKKGIDGVPDRYKARLVPKHLLRHMMKTIVRLLPL
jgi:hypothetical protein